MGRTLKKLGEKGIMYLDNLKVIVEKMRIEHRFIKFKGSLAIAFLLLFLYPFFVKGAHDFAFSGKRVFYATNQVLLHQPEHHCAVCNYEIQYTAVEPHRIVSFIILPFLAQFQSDLEESLFSISAHCIFLRGPPCDFLS